MRLRYPTQYSKALGVLHFIHAGFSDSVNPKDLFGGSGVPRVLQRGIDISTPISNAARALVAAAVYTSLGKLKASPLVAAMFPVDHVIKLVGYSAPQLAITAPALYQDYDRLRSEAALRMAIAPPSRSLCSGTPRQ